MVAHAYATVPYYRAVMDARGFTPRDFRTADDLARLPLVTSEDLARASTVFNPMYCGVMGISLDVSFVMHTKIKSPYTCPR